jgi:DNA-directed RNA polymerase
MHDDQLLAEQIALERRQISKGLDKLTKQTEKLHDKSYASATEYGTYGIQAMLPAVMDGIEATRSRLARGQNGPAFREIRKHTDELETLALAAIALKVTFDQAFSNKPKNALVVNVTTSIGRAVQDECQMRHYEREAPGLLNYLKKTYWHDSIGTQQKLANTRKAMNKADILKWDTWAQGHNIKIGTWLLEQVMTKTGWFTIDLKRTGRKTDQYVVHTDAFLRVRDTIMHDAELFSPLAWPMLIEPRDWTPENQGGYVLNEVMCGHEMVRRGNPSLIQGETIFEFINKIQKVPYRLNPFIVDVAIQLEEKGIQVGKFVPISEMPLPPKPVDIAENKESRFTYRRKAAEVNNINSQAFRRSCRTRMTMEAVKRFKDRERFYLPWSCDYRGRVYPIPAFLTPQDTDFGKSLLQFAEGAFIFPEDEEWVAFQVATTWGLDKATMAERQDWVSHNHHLITRVATDPIGNIGDWEGADEPWLFLSACEEFYSCFIDCSRHHTRLPIAVDATCSGLQILAGLARDRSTASMVNVLPGSKPQDAYKAIAEASIDQIPERLRQYWDRKKTKRSVMTICYNAKPFSNRQYIRDAFTEIGVDVTKDELTEIVVAVRDAMNEIFPGPMAVMKWIEMEVGNAIRRGHKYLEWTTPSGFTVHQQLNKYEYERLDLKLLGRCQVKVGRKGDEVDISHHKNATAPNLVHSLDASLLALSAIRFNAPLALIHDSILCRASDMDTLSSIVRETYLHLFAKHEYLKDFATFIGAETEPPMIGDLEPEQVTKSTYFFC